MKTEPHRKYSILLTDLYQLTMAYGYWKNRLHETEAVFHLFFRRNPFEAGFSVCCGLADALEYIQEFKLDEDEAHYLSGLTGNDGQPLFESAFIDYLRTMRFSCDVDAVPEGTVVFPHEPLLRVKGSILQGQLLETALLNILNFQTLIATKAARVCYAAGGDSVLEFGLRRAQGVDGAMSASRAAHIGGCAATSNVLAGMRYGIPVKGTHAHSWVMSFEEEESAFEAYAAAMPNNCVFLVDTYNTLEGVRKAVRIGHKLRERGYELLGIRLDSGDLAYLSIEARKILDENGFPKALVVASNDLDEKIIASLKQQGAKIAIWGVGTKLVTAFDQPAMGGVYKLAAIRQPNGEWRHTIKLSEQAIKVSNPGIQQVRRFYDDSGFLGDMIFNQSIPLEQDRVMIDLAETSHRIRFPEHALHEDLLVPIFEKGRLVYSAPSLKEIRARVQLQLKQLSERVQRFLNPHEYPVGLEPAMHQLKMALMKKARKEEL